MHNKRLHRTNFRCHLLCKGPHKSRVMTQRPRLQLTVYKDNAPSIQFYEKHGFTVAGEQTDEHTGHAELLMEFSRQLNTGS